MPKPLVPCILILFIDRSIVAINKLLLQSPWICTGSAHSHAAFPAVHGPVSRCNSEPHERYRPRSNTIRTPVFFFSLLFSCDKLLIGCTSRTLSRSASRQANDGPSSGRGKLAGSFPCSCYSLRIVCPLHARTRYGAPPGIYRYLGIVYDHWISLTCFGSNFAVVMASAIETGRGDRMVGSAIPIRVSVPASNCCSPFLRTRLLAKSLLQGK